MVLYNKFARSRGARRSFLIMPVQRIPRYELLLRDLRKATPEAHKDAELIAEALARVEAVNRSINEKMRRADQARKIAELSAQVRRIVCALKAPLTPTAAVCYRSGIGVSVSLSC